MYRRHTFIRLSVSAVVAIVGLSISMLTYAQSGETVIDSQTASLTIEQNSPSKSAIGSWVLLAPNNRQIAGSGASLSVGNLPSGSYTIIVRTPDGAVGSIRLLDGEEELEYIERPQLTFYLEEGNDLRVTIFHVLKRTGVVSVQSDPPGLDFTLRGPNGLTESGTTPASFDRFPVGMYSVRYETLSGCAPISQKSDQLKFNSRVSFAVRLSCESADKIRDRQETKNTSFISVRINSKDVVLRDVPQTAWFATYVLNVAKRNILSGYKNEEGEPSGEFGPGNNVTIGELAKIAHRVAGISEEAFLTVNPENARALEQWYSPFIASAEQRGWTIYQDTDIDPLRFATRSEVIVTLMQTLDIPLQWQQGDIFTDVTVRTPYAAAIETAAEDGIIDGRKDEDGNALNLFAPDEPINRAEIAKIVHEATQKYRTEQ